MNYREVSIGISLLALALGCGQAVVGSTGPAAAENGPPARTVSFGAPAGTWAALRAGTGPWQRVQSNGTDLTSFDTDASGRYSAVMVTANGTVVIFHATAAELPRLLGGRASSRPKFRVEGRIEGLEAGQRVEVQSGPTNAQYQLELEEGRHDILAAAGTYTPFGTSGEIRLAPDKFKLMRGVEVTGHRSGVDIDFSRDFALSSAFHVDAIGADTWGVGFRTANDSFWFPTHEGGLWYGLGSGLEPGDFYWFRASDTHRQMSRQVAASYSAWTTFDLTGIAPLESATVDGNLVVDGFAYAPDSRGPPLVMYEVRIDSGDREIECWVSAGWLGNASRLELSYPVGTEGWQTSWELAKGANATWRVDAMMDSRPLGRVIYTGAPEVYERRVVTQRGQVTTAL